ncbi:MAG TPA: hypothetical protein VHD36_17790 [Pirellulales bacterium]|nr:hypothetical protein [Pirellulales bacterium]
MANFVEFHHKNRKVILNLDQVCVIEERADGSDLLIRCSNSEDYLVVGGEAEKVRAAVREHSCVEK